MQEGEANSPQTLNRYQLRTPAAKLRGQYYTPPELAAMILDGLRVPERGLVLDPSCGDGSFLRGVVAAARRHLPGVEPGALAERLIGLDIDEAAVREARLGLQAAFREHLGAEIAPEAFHVHRVDVLESPSLEEILRQVGAPPLQPGEPLTVIGNPPYVEAKRLDAELKRRLKARFPGAVSGAPDLYLYFLHVCLGWLREGDRLAFVLPNRLLVNAGAQRLRERLLAEGRLRGLWLATQARLFGEAGVYPVVLFAGGPGKPLPVEVAHVTRDTRDELVRGGALEVEAGEFARTRARVFYAPPEEPLLRAALERLLPGPGRLTLDAVLDVRWSVSFHRAGLRERYVTPGRPSSPHARRFLGGGAFSGNGEVVRYGLSWGGWWIDYDEARLAAEGNPVPEAALFERPKVVLCQTGRTLRAALDEEGFVLKDTFLCGSVRNPEHPLGRHPRALVGLLCSRAIHFFYAHLFFGGHVSGGYLHFLRAFLVDLPLGAWSEALAGEVADRVREREGAPAPLRERLEEAIEARVGEALGLTPAEQDAIRDWAAADPNWQARERVRAFAPASLS